MERIGKCLWPAEKFSAAEVTRHLVLAQLFWAESERGDGGGGANARLSAALNDRECMGCFVNYEPRCDAP